MKTFTIRLLLVSVFAPTVLLAGPNPSRPALQTFTSIEADATGGKLRDAMIWTNPPTDRGGAIAAFRKVFDVTNKPTQAAISLFADARYVLWINGCYVDRGPSRFQPNGPQYDVVNVAPYLHPGANAVGLLVVGNLSGGKVMSHTPGLTALLEADGREVFRTDATWKWSDANRVRKVSASWANLSDVEVDARIEDGDWTQAAYKDTAWKPVAKIGGEAWGPLTRTLIPPLRESPVPFTIIDNAVLPVTLEAGKSVSFQTSRIVQAYPAIEMVADAGTQLTIEPYGVTYFARQGRQSYFTFDTRGVTHCEIAVKSGRATITGFKLIERLYPYDRLGSFASNDPFLNQLWEMCARSCEVLSEDSYVDCADRERVEWMDDTPPGYNITSTAMAGPGFDGKPVCGDPRLLGALVRRTGLTLQPDGWVKAHTCSDRYDIHAKMEDRACAWVEGARQYYEATGDTRILHEIWPAIVTQMDTFLQCRTSRGLVRARDWVVWGNPVGYLVGEGATLNYFVQRALADAAFLAGVVGDKAENAKFSKAAADLAQAINTVLWDEKTGGYLSGYFTDADVEESLKTGHRLRLPRTNGLTPTTLHANVFALDRGVVPQARRARVLAKMLEQQVERPDGDIMVYHYVMRQLYGLDLPEHDLRVLNLCRKGWKRMVASPLQCSWETFGGGSRAHIYGMYPGYFLSTYVLGVRMEGPVWNKRIIIEPRLGDLTSVEGVVVTRHGPVPVSWKVGDGKLTFQFEVPEGVKAALRIPQLGDNSRLVLDGKPGMGKAEGRYLAVEVGAGPHQGTLTFTKPVPRAASFTAPAAPVTVQISSDSEADFEEDVAKDSLVHVGQPSFLSITDEHFSHAGGGTNADALRNGTTLNGSMQAETINDGKTFRGYGDGDSITFNLNSSKNKAGYDLTRIVTFAGASDSRASQNYSVSVAYVSEPTKFVPLIPSASVACGGGSSKILLANPKGGVIEGTDGAKAAGVSSIRFAFRNGSEKAGPGVGFNVYREINLIGHASH